VFFVWLGASLDLRELGARPLMVALAGLLVLGAVGVHAAARLAGQPLSLAVLAGAQLGVPVSAVTIGADQHLLAPGEGGAILTAALVSVGITAWAARALPVAVTKEPTRPPSGDQAEREEHDPHHQPPGGPRDLPRAD
jgi:Kef-type K+ transport system membrane component KefB